ncbi:helix-turn-helix domain-containing protein [Streptomyces botrytidirepellens]|uniref:ArsR family transcriptional regulator n=1 Tax=Streptomyces botrytidirepellens TaxID=2486417 RepID=A0A3M8X4M1_9ACTN|nr:helix-turn-helix domain-containing protein [Streptomyces botrytidirepellens]RNG37358.1 ArsR family transcriptional regulator [Streptomyces botrytidirepellens]
MNCVHSAADTPSNVGVLDKGAALIGALAQGPMTIPELVSHTGLTRPTAHRLLDALQHEGLVDTDESGRFALGRRIVQLATAGFWNQQAATSDWVLSELQELRRMTGASTARVYRRRGEACVCVAVSSVRPDSVTGDLKPMRRASDPVIQIFLAWQHAEDQRAAHGDKANATAQIQSLAQDKNGFTSLAGPIYDQFGDLAAVLSLTGPTSHMKRPLMSWHRALAATTQRMTSSVITTYTTEHLD